MARGRVVTRRPTRGPIRVILFGLFTICLLSALFAAHFMAAFGFLVLFGIFMPNFAKRRRAAAKAASEP